MGKVWTASRMRVPTGREAACSSRHCVLAVVVVGGGGGGNVVVVSNAVDNGVTDTAAAGTGAGSGTAASRVPLVVAMFIRHKPTTPPATSSISTRRGTLILFEVPELHHTRTPYSYARRSTRTSTTAQITLSPGP